MLDFSSNVLYLIEAYICMTHLLAMFNIGSSLAIYLKSNNGIYFVNAIVKVYTTTNKLV